MNARRQVDVRIAVSLALLVGSPVALAQESAPYFVGDRILINAKVNDQPARFLFDTGASFGAIFASAGDRLKLETKPAKEIIVAGLPVKTSLAAPFDLSMLGQNAKVSMPVLPLRPAGGLDGVVSWQNVGAGTLLIDSYDRRISTLRALPNEGWQRWKIDPTSRQLFVTLTRDGKPWGRVFVDTGMACGVRLSPPLWKKWRSENPDARVTLETFRYAVGEPMVHEMAWADKLDLGDLTLHHVDVGPIPEAAATGAIDAEGKEYLATIGNRALRRLRIIISRSTQETLTQSVSPIPDHNRLGALFVRQPGDPSAWIATVLPSSPGAKAGLQDGDVLRTINGIDFSEASEPRGNSPDRFFAMRAGTTLEIRVSRSGSEHEFTVKLEDLLP